MTFTAFPRRSIAVVRIVAVALLLAGLVSGTIAPVSAQQTTATSYASDAFPFTLDWSGSWELDKESMSTDTGFERFELAGDDGLLDVILINGTDQASAYLDVLVNSVADEPKFKDLGRDEGDGFVSALVEYSVDLTSGPATVRRYYEVSDISGDNAFGDAGIFFTGSVYTLADRFDAAFASVQSDVTRNGGAPVFLGTPNADASPAKPTQPADEPTGEPTPKRTATADTSGDGIDGGTFVSPTYGFGLTWDSSEWDGRAQSEQSTDSLLLSSDVSQIEVLASDSGNGDLGDCVSSRARLVKADDGVTNFTRLTRRYTIPELPRDGFQRLYGYTQPDDSGAPIDRVVYLECRHLAGTAVVGFTFFTTDDAYEDELPRFVAILDTFDLDGQVSAPAATKTPVDDTTPESDATVTKTATAKATAADDTSTSTTSGKLPKIGKQGDETPEAIETAPADDTPVPTANAEPNPDAGISGSTFTGYLYPYTVTWDDAVWKATDTTDDSGESLSLEGDKAFVGVNAIDGLGGDVQQCLDASQALLEDDASNANVQLAEVELPKAPRGAAAAAFTYTYTSDNGNTVDFIEYIECRVLVKDTAVLRISYLTGASIWTDQIAAAQAIVDGVKIGKPRASTPPTTTAPPAKTPTTKKTPASTDAAIGVKGTTYTSPSYGYSLPFGADWNVVDSTSADAQDTLRLSNGTSDVLVIGGVFDADATACQQAMVDAFSTGDGVSEFNPVKNDKDVPIYGETNNGTYGLYSFTLDRKSTFAYIQCQIAPTGGYGVVYIQTIPVAAFKTELDGLNALSNAIEFA